MSGVQEQLAQRDVQALPPLTTTLLPALGQVFGADKPFGYRTFRESLLALVHDAPAYPPPRRAARSIRPNFLDASPFMGRGGGSGGLQRGARTRKHAGKGFGEVLKPSSPVARWCNW